MAFAVAAVLAALVVWRWEGQQVEQERQRVAFLAQTYAGEVERNIQRALSATYPLAALVREQGGGPADFNTLAAQLLPYYPGAAALLVAPAGVVSHIVPVQGNEAALGHDLLNDPGRFKEARLARDTGLLTLAGPFNLVQGGLAAAGRLPVYLGAAGTRERFWGLVGVLIRFPDVLDRSRLTQLVADGYAFELWRTHPDTGQRHVIASAGGAVLNPVELRIAVPNATWTLDVVPVQGWHDATLLATKIAGGLLLSLLFGAIVSLLARDRLLRKTLEARVLSATTDLRHELAERLRVEHSLRDAEARLQGYIDNAPVSVFVADATGRCIDVNPAACALVGYRREELLGGMGMADLASAAGAPREVALFSKVLRNGQGEFDLKLRRKDGAVVTVAMRSTRLASGHVMGFANDITAQRQAEQALVESEDRFARFMDALPAAAFIKNADGTHVFGNRYLQDVVGGGATTGKSNTELFPAAVASSISAQDALALTAGHIVVEEAIPDRSGTLRHFETHKFSIARPGRPPLLGGIALDITQRKLAEAHARQAMTVFSASAQGIMTTAIDGTITSINPAFSAITGYAAEEVIGRRPSMFRSNRHDPAFYAGMWATLTAAGQWEGEIWNRRRNGQIYPQWLTITSVRGAQGEISEYVALFNDITERKQQEEAIWRQANFDALTGLANRNLFADRLERALAHARRNHSKVGLVFLDLDGFKWINDTLGHDVGDELLVEAGRRLRGCVREEDTVARPGGDEFTVVIHDLATGEDMLAIGEKLVGVLAAPFTLAGGTQQLSGSVGITVYPDDGEDVQTLLKNADIAMYKAKQGGKNRCQFYARHMQVDAQARMQMEADLRAALANQAFTLHYQPIVDADSGELVGAEALIRWLHPERGMVAPLDFIPVAEDCGLIVPIGTWVLREAARQWRAWCDAGHAPLRLSVNVSSVQFRETSFCQIVAAALHDFAIPPGMLVLEITESGLMDGSPEAEARLCEIKELGIGYALDDFGTGFSSLSYLKRFPVDIVKIDRSFINDCPDDHNDAHLVEAIIHMAHSLDRRVTAEGVETEEQYEFLRELGCDFLQGYLVGRPVPAEAFAILIQRRQLLLPIDGASTEESRFLAALRLDEVDVEFWLQRLLGDPAHDGLEIAVQADWHLPGLDVRAAVQCHLDWRQRLDGYINTYTAGATMSLHAAGSTQSCALGQWISERRDGADPCLARLDLTHQAFHRLAGRIVEDLQSGHRSLARRTLSGISFRRCCRDLMTALIACYRNELLTH